MSEITMYSTRICPFCQRADQLLQRKGLTVTRKILVDQDPRALIEMHARTARRSVPQIFIGDHHVGGFDDLARLDREGQLDRLLAACASAGPTAGS